MALDFAEPDADAVVSLGKRSGGTDFAIKIPGYRVTHLQFYRLIVRIVAVGADMNPDQSLAGRSSMFGTTAKYHGQNKNE